MSLITKIQRYSVHDGDGIRTTVFFKGCPLRCVWCHNPETQSYQNQLLVDHEKCVGCGACVKACPRQAIRIQDGREITDHSLCISCGACEDVCLLDLRKPAGQEYTVEQLVKEVQKDEIFYEQSGGGVTLSGGEVMASDMDFVEALVKRFFHVGITVTIDTCGQAPYENFQRILPYVDTFLYDIKVLDASLHKKYIGSDNTQILSNLERLSRDGARIYIRIPTVKEVNGTEESMRQVIRYLQEKHIQVANVNLLPYHNTGSGKYGRLGETYQGMDLHAPDPEEMQRFVELFKQSGFSKVKIGG